MFFVLPFFQASRMATCRHWQLMPSSSGVSMSDTLARYQLKTQFYAHRFCIGHQSPKTEGRFITEGRCTPHRSASFEGVSHGSRKDASEHLGHRSPLPCVWEEFRGVLLCLCGEGSGHAQDTAHHHAGSPQAMAGALQSAIHRRSDRGAVSSLRTRP